MKMKLPFNKRLPATALVWIGIMGCILAAAAAESGPPETVPPPLLLPDRIQPGSQQGSSSAPPLMDPLSYSPVDVGRAFIWTTNGGPLVTAQSSAVEILRAGMAAEASKNLEGAAKAYRDAVQRFNDQREQAAIASWRLAEVLRQLGRTNEAITELQRVVRNYNEVTNLVKLSRKNLSLFSVAEPAADPEATPRNANLGTSSPGTGVPGAGGFGPAPASSKAAQSLEKSNDPMSELLKRYGLQYSQPAPGMAGGGIAPERNERQGEAENQRPLAAGSTLPAAGIRSMTTGFGMGPITPVVNKPEDLDELASRFAFIRNNLNGDSKVLAVLAAFPDDALQGLMEQKRNVEMVYFFESERLKESGKDTTQLLERHLKQQERFTEWIQRRVDEIMKSKELLLAMSRKSPVETGNSTSVEEVKELERLDIIAENSPDLLHAQESNGETRLHRAASQGWISVAGYLLEHQADPNSPSASGGRTPLHNAVNKGHKAMVQFLITKGANVNSPDDSGNTALHIASTEGFRSILNLLLEKGAKIKANTSGYSPVHAAAGKGRAEILEILQKAGGDMDARTSEGYTPLMLAIVGDKAKSAEYLLRIGVAVNGRSNNGETPLTLALYKNSRKEMTLMLLQKGADAKLAGADGVYPLMRAVLSDADSEVLAALLKQGAKPNIGLEKESDLGANESVTAPLHFAAERNNEAAVSVLLKNGANPSIRRKYDQRFAYQLTRNVRIQKMLVEAGFDLKRLEEPVPPSVQAVPPGIPMLRPVPPQSTPIPVQIPGTF